MLIQDPQAVAESTTRFGLLQSHAYNVDESRNVIRTLMEGYERA